MPSSPPTEDSPFRIVTDGVQVAVRLTPRSSRNAIIGIRDGRLAIALTAPPVEGAANEALIRFLASTLEVSKRCIALVRGEKSREKLLFISTTKASHIIKILSAK